MDAHACNRETKEPLVFPVIVLRRYHHDDLDLSYRHSRFREHRLTHIDAQGHLVFPARGLIEPAELVVTLGLRLHRQDPSALGALLEQHAQERQQDDPAQRHGGSIFKDPAGFSARALIEQAGLGGRKHGNAQVSERNANYIVNLGGASADDIATLIIEAHQAVLLQRGIPMPLLFWLGTFKGIG
jgi:UDP-N-acetylmuramate dehydrogenase